ncbi:12741_t:CDS:2 [Racocetra fulgida]|uniref:12741_t:CDS:1 n=1 Tax=Racocetra fulgida TaxID=60492 RepID=A0A9N9BC30_9GLOM|nr:12741_t:CDS:2 [Racocetra fulgida]
MNGLADINTPPSHAIFTSPPKIRGISNSNQLLLQPLQQPTSQIPSQTSLQIPSQTSLQMPSQTPLQMSSQILLQLSSQIASQIPSQIPLQMPSQLSSQIPTIFFSHFSNIPLQVLPNIPLYILSNITSHPYFIPFPTMPNLSQGSMLFSKYVPELEEFLTQIDKAENANGEILACLSMFQNQAIQVKWICKLTDEQLELVGITKTGWKVALQEASKEYNQ